MPRAELMDLAAERLDAADIVITSYGSLLRLPWMTRRLWRLVVVDEAQAIKNPSARQTRAVKALEEPGPRQLFVLVADDALRLAPTIRSRAQAVRLGPVRGDELARWLLERRPMTDEQATTLARLADGRVGRARTLADRPELLRLYRALGAVILAAVPDAVRQEGHLEVMRLMREDETTC